MAHDTRHCLDCKKPSPKLTRGLCNACYQRHRTLGTIDKFPQLRQTFRSYPIKQRLADARDAQGADPERCWLWPGKLARKGYGTVSTERGTEQVHRVAYELWVRPIPDGLVVDHTCHNADRSCHAGNKCPHRRCFNPSHLDVTTRPDNSARAASRREYCAKAGHPLTEDNIITRVLKGTGNVSISCLACYRDYHDEYERTRRKRGAAKDARPAA